jgi:UTP--glucose-1-phosphate uridylyltransferase
MVKKAVIPAAGLGTRLLTATKEQPKEMLPIFAKARTGEICLKPMLQLIFEQLYEVGFRDFCIVIGRAKRAIEDHFTPDGYYISMLNGKGKRTEATTLDEFYELVRNSRTLWVGQPEALGFGDAVLRAEAFVGNDPIMVHAGDTYIIAPGENHIVRLMKAYESLEADIVFLIEKVEDTRQYGVIAGDEETDGIYRVTDAIEKPTQPPTNLAIMPVYIFKPEIMKVLRSVRPGVGGEIQLTDAIKQSIVDGKRVYALSLGSNEVRLDIGSPQTYWEALRLSHSYAAGKT